MAGGGAELRSNVCHIPTASQLQYWRWYMVQYTEQTMTGGRAEWMTMMYCHERIVSVMRQHYIINNHPNLSHHQRDNNQPLHSATHTTFSFCWQWSTRVMCNGNTVPVVTNSSKSNLHTVMETKSVTTEIRLSDCHHCWHFNSNTNGNWCTGTFTAVSTDNSPHEYHKGRV